MSDNISSNRNSTQTNENIAQHKMNLKQLRLAVFEIAPSTKVKWTHPLHAMDDVAHTQVTTLLLKPSHHLTTNLNMP